MYTRTHTHTHTHTRTHTHTHKCPHTHCKYTHTNTHTHTHTHTQTLEEDVDGFVSVVEGLGREAKGLVSANHFDASNISARQVAT